MELRQAIPRPVTVWKFIVQFVAVVGFISPFMWAGLAKVKAQAQELINETVDDRFGALETQLDGLTDSIDRLVSGQVAETDQSEEEARINRQILCLQELAVDPTRGTIEDCQAIE